MHLVTLYKHRLPTIGTAFISHLVKEMRAMKMMTLLSDFSPSSKSQMLIVRKRVMTAAAMTPSMIKTKMITKNLFLE